MFSETHLDIFNTQTAEWVQSIGLKRSSPLSQQGNIVLTHINDSPNIVYLANIHTSMAFNFNFSVENKHIHKFGKTITFIS